MPSRDRRTSSSRPSAPSASAVVEGRDRVLRRERGAAAVGEHQRPRRLEERMGRHTRPSLTSDRIDAWRTPFKTLGDLRRQRGAGSRPVKQEIRDNLVRKLQAGETLFPGIIGYDDTVIPQLVNAILSRHNFILLGLRGQAKSRILRGLIDLLDEQIPVVPGCEIHDDPLAPICARLPRARRDAKATACRSPGCRARRASSRSSRRRT